MKIDQDRRPAIRAELVVQVLLSEPIIFQSLIAGMPDDVGWSSVYEHVAVLRAYRAIAAIHLRSAEVVELDLVSDGSAVTIRLVPSLLQLVRIR